MTTIFALTLLSCLFASCACKKQEDVNQFIEVEQLNNTCHPIENYNIIIHNKEEQCLISSKCNVNQWRNVSTWQPNQFESNVHSFKKKSGHKCIFCAKGKEPKKYLSIDKQLFLSTYAKVKAQQEKELEKLLGLYMKIKQSSTSTYLKYISKEEIDNLISAFYNFQKKKDCGYLAFLSDEFDNLMKKIIASVYQMANKIDLIEIIPWLAINAFMMVVVTSFLNDLYQSHLKSLERRITKIQRKHKRCIAELRHLILKVKNKRQLKDILDERDKGRNMGWEPIFDHL